MTKEVQLRFDYATLDTDTRAFVLERAEKIHKIARMTAAGIVQIGQHLTEVKERLAHGEFLKWIEREFGWGRSSADRFMDVFHRVKLPKLGNLQIDVSALYLIAAPATPEPVRQEVMRRAETGEKVTHSTVRAVIHEYKETGDAPAAVGKLFDAVRTAQEQNAATQRALPSPAEARRAAIETGAHTLDRNGVYQPPMSEKEQAEWRADWKLVTPLYEFLRWIATDVSPADILRIIRARAWDREFASAGRSATWLRDFERMKQ